jgi:hypothetical protein
VTTPINVVLTPTVVTSAPTPAAQTVNVTDPAPITVNASPGAVAVSVAATPVQVAIGAPGGPIPVQQFVFGGSQPAHTTEPILWLQQTGPNTYQPWIIP